MIGLSTDFLCIRNVRSANRINALPHIVTRRTNRECHGLMMKLEGETVYSFEDGTKLVSDAAHICLIPQNSSYTWQTTGGECYVIEFDADMPSKKPLVFSAYESDEPLKLFYGMEHALINGDALGQMKAISNLYRILLFLLEKPIHYSPKSKERIIEKGIELMKTDYANPDLTVSDLAKASGISEVYFRKLYSELYGTSPIKALISVRMKKAVELLSSDYNSVTAIAQAVGYNSIYHFSKIFKQYYGVAPTEYKHE